MYSLFSYMTLQYTKHDKSVNVSILLGINLFQWMCAENSSSSSDSLQCKLVPCNINYRVHYKLFFNRSTILPFNDFAHKSEVIKIITLIRKTNIKNNFVNCLLCVGHVSSASVKNLGIFIFIIFHINNE